MSKRCNQCEALVINGVFCHEHGCLNEKKEFVDGEWVDPEVELYDGPQDVDYNAPTEHERAERQDWIQRNLK